MDDENPKQPEVEVVSRSQPDKTAKLTRRKLSSAEQLARLATDLIADADSGRELFNTVVPLLREQDERRDNEMSALAGELQKRGESPTFTAGELRDILEVLQGYIERKGRANRLFGFNAVVSLVSRFDQFFSDLLKIMLSEHPDRLNSSDRKLTYGEAVRLSSIDELKERFIQDEVDSVMRDSHDSQLCYLERQLKIDDLKQLIGTWSVLFELTERRNVCVHCGGAATKKYVDACSGVLVGAPDVKVGTFLVPDLDYYDSRCDAVIEVAVKLAQIVSRKIAPRSLKEVDDAINKIGFRLLEKQRFKLARIMFSYAVKLPPKIVSDDAFRRIFLVNLCIALEALGETDELKKTLFSMDWSAADAKFILATQTLQDEFDKAEKTMASMRSDGPISEVEFLHWPLFRDFRNTENFQRAFRQIFGKDYVTSALREAQQKLATADKIPASTGDNNQDDETNGDGTVTVH